MSRIAVAVILAAGAYVGMVLLVELGRRLWLRQLVRDPEGARAGAGPIDGAVFALLGLNRCVDDIERPGLRAVAAGAAFPESFRRSS